MSRATDAINPIHRVFQPPCGAILVGLCAAILRIARVLGPNVQIEDPNYIYGAFLLSMGARPFADFAQVNPPLLEQILSGLYAVFGVSYRVPEILSAVAYIATALLIYGIGSRWFTARAGLLAGILYSMHFLVFRYHLFEREIYATLAVAAAVYLLAREPGPALRMDLPAGVVAGLGFAFKQTALIPFAAVLGMLLVVYGRPMKAVWPGLGFVGTVGLINLGYWLQYGNAFLDQTFWFHFIKGTVAPWYIKLQWTTAALGYLLPLMAAGLVLLRLTQSCRAWIFWSMVAADTVFFCWITGAFWPHYLLATLLPAALIAGDALDRLITGFQAGKAGSRIRAASAVLTGLGIAAVSLVHPSVQLLGQGVASEYGFSGTPRREVAQVAGLIQANSPEDRLIIADPFIGLVSQRVKVVNFKDNWGLILWMQQAMREGTYRENVRALKNVPFGRIRKNSEMYWMPMVTRVLESGRVGAVQRNYELPVTQDELSRAGFELAARTAHYEIWLPK